MDGISLNKDQVNGKISKPPKRDDKHAQQSRIKDQDEKRRKYQNDLNHQYVKPSYSSSRMSLYQVL
jgi:hypothetical protein